MPRDRTAWALAIGVLAAIAGCDAHEGAVPIEAGTPCDVCGMRIENLRYAGESRDGRAAPRFYDSIECVLRAAPAGSVWLTDYDTRRLHAADSVWVVQGSFPSPMGGGFASFLNRDDAVAIASSRGGRVDRWSAFRSAAPAARAERP